MAELIQLASYSKMSQKNLTVGTTAVAFPTPAPMDNVVQPEIIFVQAPMANTGNIVIGLSGVLADLTQGGFQLIPGANFTLPFNKDEVLKAVATAAGQTLLVTYLASAD